MVKLSGRFSDHTWLVIKYAIGIAAVIFFVFPIFWLFKASFNKPIDAVVLPPVWIFKPEIRNYIDIFIEEPFLKYLRNSVLISGGATFLAILIGFPAAYAFARADFRFKKDLAFWILSIFMFPPLASILPMLILFKHLRLVDTVPGIILAHLTFLLPLSVWLLQRFIRDIPIEVEEAALVDGAKTFIRLRRVVLPIIANGIATTAIFCFIFSWNDFIFALVLAPGSAKTLPVASVSLSSWAYINWGKISAASMIITGPVFLLILLTRRYLVRGFTFGLK
ncbi:MAG: carbohydrate ABC transporter permease [Desulfobacterales bacterium]|jgi:multiple sugar transport system permease protein